MRRMTAKAGGTYEEYVSAGWSDAQMVAWGLMEKVTLWDVMRESYERDCRKHDLAPDPEAFADERINSLTNVELLRDLSFALEELLAP